MCCTHIYIYSQQLQRRVPSKQRPPMIMFIFILFVFFFIMIIINDTSTVYHKHHLLEATLPVCDLSLEEHLMFPFGPHCHLVGIKICVYMCVNI